MVQIQPPFKVMPHIQKYGKNLWKAESLLSSLQEGGSPQEKKHSSAQTGQYSKYHFL